MTGDAADCSRERAIYRGRVQGVGFRFTVLGISRGYDVAGFVRNLPDGSVELEVEGGTSAVRAFLDEIAATFASNIDSAERQPLTSPQETDQPARFEIRV